MLCKVPTCQGLDKRQIRSLGLGIFRIDGCYFNNYFAASAPWSEALDA